MSTNIVIVGGGHAAAAVRRPGRGRAGRARPPGLRGSDHSYHRPPLSKTFLKSPDEQPQLHRAEAWYAESGITLHLGDAALAIDRAARTVTLQSGAVLGWERLVLATGTRARRLSALAGLSNVALLRAADEAAQLRNAARPRRST